MFAQYLVYLIIIDVTLLKTGSYRSGLTNDRANRKRIRCIIYYGVHRLTPYGFNYFRLYFTLNSAIISY